jgi:hypothetical protein
LYKKRWVYATHPYQFRLATYSFTGNKKPGGVTPSAPLALLRKGKKPKRVILDSTSSFKVSP